MSEEESYRITPRGWLYAQLNQPLGLETETALVEYMKKAGVNAIILEDNHLVWENVAKEWD